MFATRHAPPLCEAPSAEHHAAEAQHSSIEGHVKVAPWVQLVLSQASEKREAAIPHGLVTMVEESMVPDESSEMTGGR